MNWTVWAQVEKMLLDFSIRPIAAVIPANQDVDLMVSAAHADFWGEVRRWQALGWTIALHGFQHLHVTRDAGIVGIAARSEFAGLPSGEQEEKLHRGMAIFAREGIRPTVWVAPSHSFDGVTLPLLQGIGIEVISDGFALAPHCDRDGLLWIPQQLWKFRWRPAGVWTVCSHINRWTSKDIASFHSALKKYRARISDLDSIREVYSRRHRHFMDDVYAGAHLGALSLRRRVGRVA
jgi:predicted deacetylase